MNYRRFRGRRGRVETFNDQKMEVDAKRNFQPITHGIPYHTKTTTTSKGVIMT
jgi:hypothetical protein